MNSFFRSAVARAPRSISHSLLLAMVPVLLSSRLCAADEGKPGDQSVKVLTVGNSFADDACVLLPALAKAGGKDLVLVRANLGGHSLAQHVGYLQAYEANADDPKGSPYNAPAYLATGDKKKINLKAILASKPWNFVTIQQVSNNSFQEETYEPFAGILIDYIRKNAPTAEILIQQTWAYREDHEMFKDGKLNQQSMYAGLKAAYDKLAQRYSLRIIPSGDAYQAARKLPRWTFSFPDPKFDYSKPAPGTLPDQHASLNVGWKWDKDKTTNEPKLVLDAKHSNLYGRFLISCVWYEVIFNDSVLNNPFVPEGMSPEDAMILRQVAHEVVAARKATEATLKP
ncbi:hypothetical protein TSACC_3353 [Terrimicrobium sacchariphilum]|uniref:DUF4886 domain-containing protein n=1 Tax=Terrimicrobium sacchariphilum TaxID=690879 RepID=A0A146GFR4_TERSA|nr:DUF4886 domain-containing protein [Terrimicrobium sacchariphilum]GAT35288.1 hypothetical protein TSACC_3353 [Terrimicrobium sacchariphilum]